jgi:hypothetical protein
MGLGFVALRGFPFRDLELLAMNKMFIAVLVRYF